MRYFYKQIILSALSLVLSIHPTHAKHEKPLRFAVIGDFGSNKPEEGEVARMVQNWKPDFIVTLGDNNYPDGKAETIDENIGQYYHNFIYPYKGTYGKGADRNRFFPILGNHDWRAEGAQPYLDYFTLPGNGRYYDFQWGPVHFFALDSDKHEPDGITADSDQAAWLKEKLAQSSAPYKVVLLHHPPYSSGHHQSTVELQWPYKEWGAQLVMSGHDHDYQRIEEGGITYVINGIGGQSLRKPFEHPPIPGTKKRIHDQHGAMLCEANKKALKCELINVRGKTLDKLEVKPKRTKG